MPRTRCAPSPREAKRSGERVGVRGNFSARPPHSILQVATTEVPSPRKRGEGAITMTARVVTSHHFSTQPFSFPRRVFCARVLQLWLRYPDRRVAERRESSGACEAPVGPARNAAGQAPNEAPCVPYGGRPPPGALTVAILGSGPALPSPELLPDRSQRAPRVRVVVPGGRGPVPPGAAGCESLPQDATPRSVFRMPPDDAPS